MAYSHSITSTNAQPFQTQEINESPIFKLSITGLAVRKEVTGRWIR